MRRAGIIVAAAAAPLLAGCATDTQPGSDSSTAGTPPASSVSGAPGSPSAGNGALIVYPRPGPGAQRYPISTEGSIGPPTPVPWEIGPDAEATLLQDAAGPWALTATVELPLTDVSATTGLQVRDVATGQVVHQIDVPGWCSGPDGADWSCLLLDRDRMVRTTGMDGIGAASITISSTENGRTLAEYGPFPGLADVRATPSPDVLVLITFDEAAAQHTAVQLDTSTGDLTSIGSLPTTQQYLCVLGTDSLLTNHGTTLQVLGPADVAPVEVPELAGGGPGVVGCSADGTHLYLRTDWTADPEQELVIDALTLTDGTRTPAALTLPSQQGGIQITR
jgi:hypothetical protein